MASKVATTLVVLTLGASLYVSRCSHVAYADDYLVADDYATHGDVSRLDGSVTALTGSVSSGINDMQDDLYGIGAQVDKLVEGEQEVREDASSAKEDSRKAAEGVAKANESLDAQGQLLDTVAADVRTLTENQGDLAEDDVSQMSIDDLLALVPADASDQITEYMQYPFIMGCASGVVAYLISLATTAVYRLLGFH